MDSSDQDSTFSGPSCYEEEFKELKALITPSEHAACACLSLKIKLEEALAGNRVKQGTIEALKLKIARQHVQGLNYLKHTEELKSFITALKIKEEEWAKAKAWYQDELKKVSNLKEEVLSLKLQLRECQSKLNVKEIEHLKSFLVPKEMEALKNALAERDESILKLTQENAQMIILQQHVKQLELDRNICENSLKELQKQHETLKSCNKNFEKHIEQLRMEVVTKEVELKTRNEEKLEVERSVEVLRQQFLVFRENYVEVKKELANKNAEIQKLTKANIKTQDITDDQKFETFKNRQCQIEQILDQLNIQEFQGEVDIRLKFLQNKLEKLDKTSNFIRESLLNKIARLELLLQVKQREMGEKRKKMDQNHSLLLRKVKELMRGRHFAEKQLQNGRSYVAVLQEQVRTLRNDRDFLRRLNKDLFQAHVTPLKSTAAVQKTLPKSSSIGPVNGILQGCIEGLRADIEGLRGKVLEKCGSS